MIAVKKNVVNDIFKSANGFVLGDVAQSLFLISDTAYIVLNNSQHVILADAAHNFKYIDTIGLPGASPRYFLPASGSKAYITELYANKIWIVDYQDKKADRSYLCIGLDGADGIMGRESICAGENKSIRHTCSQTADDRPATDHIDNSLDSALTPAVWHSLIRINSLCLHLSRLHLLRRQVFTVSTLLPFLLSIR
jgi:hypothetical protein